jgi:hypothetical protein
VRLSTLTIENKRPLYPLLPLAYTGFFLNFEINRIVLDAGFRKAVLFLNKLSAPIQMVGCAAPSSGRENQKTSFMLGHGRFG